MKSQKTITQFHGVRRSNSTVARRITTFSISMAVLVVLAIFAMSSQGPNVKAQDQVPPPVGDRVSFGLVGITAGQTARISVANTIMPNDIALPPGPVRVVMSFRGMNGQLVRNRGGEVIRRNVELDRGDAAFLDLDYDQLPPSPIRAQIRPVVTVQYPSGEIAEHKPIVVGAEVINNANGRTQFGVYTDPAVVRGFNPQPDPPVEP